MDHNQQPLLLRHILFYRIVFPIWSFVNYILEGITSSLVIMTFGILKPHKTASFVFALRDQARQDTEEAERCLLELTTVYSQINDLYLEIDEESKQLMALAHSPDAELRLDEVRAYVSGQVDKMRAVETLEERVSSLGLPAQRSQWALLSGAWREAW